MRLLCLVKGVLYRFFLTFFDSFFNAGSDCVGAFLQLKSVHNVSLFGVIGTHLLIPWSAILNV